MIKSIFIAKAPKQALQSMQKVEVVIGAGISGDRHFNKAQWPGENITFIAMEAIENFNASHGQAIDLSATRRNVITQGVDLNALVGKVFSIGNAKFKGIELCEPCIGLGQSLANESISKAEVVKAFLVSGGLRADVIGSGTISVDMAFKPA